MDRSRAIKWANIFTALSEGKVVNRVTIDGKHERVEDMLYISENPDNYVIMEDEYMTKVIKCKAMDDSGATIYIDKSNIAGIMLCTQDIPTHYAKQRGVEVVLCCPDDITSYQYAFFPVLEGETDIIQAHERADTCAKELLQKLNCMVIE